MQTPPYVYYTEEAACGQALVELLLPSSAGLADDDKLAEKSGSVQPSDQWYNWLHCCHFSPSVASPSILTQHLVLPWESWSRLFSPAIALLHVLIHSQSPLPLFHSHALSIPSSSSPSRVCVAGSSLLCPLNTDRRVMCGWRERKWVFFLRCLPPLFCCGALPVTLIWRSYVDAFVRAEPHAHRSFVCFSFFHLVKSLLFLRTFLCFVLTSSSVFNGTQLRINSFIQINCRHIILLIKQDTSLVLSFFCQAAAVTLIMKQTDKSLITLFGGVSLTK